MKKITLLALTAFMMVGCEYRTNSEKEEAKRLGGFDIVVIDSCEYLKKDDWAGYQGFGYFAHKGNCKFCAERRKKELDSLALKIWEGFE